MKAAFQFGNSIVLFAVSIYLMFALLPISYVLTLALSVIASIAYLRLFMIGHDCSHRSYLPKRWQNMFLGNFIGVLTNTPLHYWGSQHATHHRTTGNLDRRGTGDVTTLKFPRNIFCQRAGSGAPVANTLPSLLGWRRLQLSALSVRRRRVGDHSRLRHRWELYSTASRHR